MDDIFGKDDSDQDCDDFPSMPKSVDFLACDIRNSTTAGGRGVFALRDIPAGQLVVLEWPLIRWSVQGGISSLSDIDDIQIAIIDILNTRDKPADQSLSAWNVCKLLHPSKFEDASSDEIDNAKEQLIEWYKSNSEIFNGVSIEEIIRLFLVLQHNGFVSGLYNTLCMINHSCDGNAIKFEPRPGSRGASEVWTTKAVKAGEEITICYISPHETVTLISQEYLFSQHGFYCECTRCGSISSGVLEVEDTLRVGKKLQENLQKLEIEIYESIDDMGRNIRLSWVTDKIAGLVTLIEDIQMKLSLHVRSDMIRLEARARVLLSHLLTSYLSTLTVNSSKIKGNNKIKLESQESKEEKQFLSPQDISKRLIDSSCELHRLQLEYIGPDHPNIGTTLQDIANAVEALLCSCSPEDISDSVKIILRSSALRDILRDSTETNPIKIVSDFHREVNRINDLYSLVKRCPAAIKVPKEPGKAFWGTVSDT